MLCSHFKCPYYINLNMILNDVWQKNKNKNKNKTSFAWLNCQEYLNKYDNYELLFLRNNTNKHIKELLLREVQPGGAYCCGL